MTAIRLKHISRFRDRHGHLRHYLRLPGRKPVPLPGMPGSPAFMAAYNAAITGAHQAPPDQRQPPAGTLDALAVAYYRHPTFAALRASTQRAYRRIVERLRAKHGDKPIRMLDAQGVRVILAECSGNTAANHRLRVLRLMLAVAVEHGDIAADPTAGVKRRRHTTTGYRTWPEDLIARYQAHHPTGTTARLAFELLLHTAQRRSDVVRMGRQHIRAGRLDIRTVKTDARVTVPIHPDLAAELARLPEGRLTFLTTPAGAPYTANGFYMRFRAWCDAAGIPKGYSPHGLRKSTARRIAEGGGSSKEIGAVLGDKTLSVVEIYVREADDEKLAAAGMARIGNAQLPTGSEVGRQVGNRRGKARS
jgi:integrase